MDLNSLQIELKIQLLDANGARALVNPNSAYFVDNILYPKLKTGFLAAQIFSELLFVKTDSRGS